MFGFVVWQSGLSPGLRTISGGISWGELAPPLMLVNPVVTPILTLYIALATSLAQGC